MVSDLKIICSSYYLDGICGEVLFYSIQQTIGSTAYTAEVHRGWIKIYSKMLTAIVPLVVHYELLMKEQQELQVKVAKVLPTISIPSSQPSSSPSVPSSPRTRAAIALQEFRFLAENSTEKLHLTVTQPPTPTSIAGIHQ